LRQLACTDRKPLFDVFNAALDLRIIRIHPGDLFQVFPDRFEVAMAGQFDSVAKSLDRLKSLKVFRAHDAILH